MDKQQKNWHQECAYAYFFEGIKGVGAKTIGRLYERYGSYEAMYKNGKQSGDILKGRQREAFFYSKKIWDIEKEYIHLLRNKIWCVPKMLKGYPDQLMHIDLPPSALFVKGRLPNPDKPAAALVGARDSSPYGDYVAAQLGKELAKQGIQVISGMARGIDSIGQCAAVEAEGFSFGVLGCGVDICYPEESRGLYERLSAGEGGGGVISELFPGTAPLAGFFPMRNRIISALSQAVIVVEAREKSGTFITVSEALDQGKDVYALPGRLNDPLSLGCNRLIAQGAFAVYDVEECVGQIWERFYATRQTSGRTAAYDIIRELTAEEVKAEETSKKKQDSDTKMLILNKLDIQFASLDEIMAGIEEKTSVAVVLAVLSTLECEGKVEREGSFYRKRID